MNLHRLFLYLVFLLVCFSVAGQSPSEMTDQEILTELIALNKQKASELDARELSLNERESRLEFKETNLTLRENNLSEREQSMIALGNFSQSLREEIKKEARSDYWRGFAHGFAVGGSVGLAGGGWAGFKIGVRY